jgi:hypothetical protein
VVAFEIAAHPGIAAGGAAPVAPLIVLPQPEKAGSSDASESALHNKLRPLRLVRSQSSNAMLGSGPTTPQDYPENSGFAPRRERECGHRRH